MGNALAKITKYRRRMKYMFDEFEGKTPWVLILGLDEAGKTTLLYKNKLKHTVYAVPPRGVNIEQLTPRRGTTLQIYDVTGDKLTRHLWRDWFHNTEAIVYVVDSTNRERIDEAKFELHDLLRSRRLKKTVPVVVVANKQDMDGALPVDVVSGELCLGEIKNREWAIFGASANTGVGVSAVFLDVVAKILAYRQAKKDTAKGISASGGVVEPKAGTSNGYGSSSANSEEKPYIENHDDTVPSLFDNVRRKSSISSSNSEDEQQGHSYVNTPNIPPPSSIEDQPSRYPQSSVVNDEDRDISDAVV